MKNSGMPYSMTIVIDMVPVSASKISHKGALFLPISVTPVAGASVDMADRGEVVSLLRTDFETSSLSTRAFVGAIVKISQFSTDHLIS